MNPSAQHPSAKDNAATISPTAAISTHSTRDYAVSSFAFGWPGPNSGASRLRLDHGRRASSRADRVDSPLTVFSHRGRV